MSTVDLNYEYDVFCTMHHSHYNTEDKFNTWRAAIVGESHYGEMVGIEDIDHILQYNGYSK